MVMYRVVHIVLCKNFICSVGYRLCYVHVQYVVLCTYCTVCMLDMQCCMHRVLSACWNAEFGLFSRHFGHFSTVRDGSMTADPSWQVSCFHWHIG